MNILFVSSGNSKTGEISPFIQSQAKAISTLRANFCFFRIFGKGLIGYLKAVRQLRRYLKTSSIDLIYAHYSLSGWVAVLSCTRKPIVLSLMGDDTNGTYIRPGKISLKSRFLMLLTIVIQPFISAVISKSKHISNIVWQKTKVTSF